MVVTDEQQLLTRLIRLEALVRAPHSHTHELSGGDEIRYAVQNQGTRLTRHRELNFSTGLTAVADTAGRRITVTNTLDTITELTATAWRVFYSNGAGAIVELALGAVNTVLTSNGAAAAPTWAAAGSGWSPVITAQSGAYTAVKNDVVLCTGTFVVTLTASATVGTGGIIIVKNVSTGIITVTPAGAETIDGAAGSLSLAPNDAYTLITNASNWFII